MTKKVKFKVGDKVKCLEGNTYHNMVVGGVYTVSAVDRYYIGLQELNEDMPYWKHSRFEKVVEPQTQVSDEKRTLDKVRGLHGDWRIAAADVIDAKEKEYNKLVELKSAAETFLAIKDISIEDINLLAEVIRA